MSSLTLFGFHVTLRRSSRSLPLKGLPVIFQQTRSARTKPKPPRPAMGEPGWFSQEAMDRDERLLAKLQAQLERANAQLKAEETEQAAYLKRSGMTPEKASALYTWEKVFNAQDRQTMINAGINSFDEMLLAFEDADQSMSNDPHPRLEELPLKLRVAYKMYRIMPQRMARGPLE